MKRNVKIRRATPTDKPEWLRMRQALWPEHSTEDFAVQSVEILGDPSQAVFVFERLGGSLGGFVEAGTRKYAEGCQSSPVGYIEGWYVDEDLRGLGIGVLLMGAAEDWARALGLTEIASDTWLENETSIQAHLKMGYQEFERLVHFAKKL